MAHKKYANALMSENDIHFEKWMDEVRMQHEGVVSSNHINRIASTVLRKADPKQYLLSHATIVASVDTFKPKNIKLGAQFNRGVQINVKYPDFRVKPECSKLINSNGDMWDRRLLLSTYKTFVGAPNYCFLPEMNVLMADGTQCPIIDVEVGDSVISHTGNVRKVVYKHIRDYEGEIKHIYVDDNKPILCTPNHEFFRLFKSDSLIYDKVRADELIVQDSLFIPIIGTNNIQTKIINRIESGVYKGKVYNIEVEEDHSYVIENVSVSNCEHIQIPELSKGFIVDAISRDLGETCYIDILVATDRKHSKLIQDILSGEMSALSMGAISQFTICTKCGNVAADDSELCICILHDGKGNFYQDENGIDHIIGELCGFYTVPESNQFIEASWVKNPAFKGAVRRNFLNKDMITTAAKLNSASKIYEVRKEEKYPEELKRAASVKRHAADDDAPLAEGDAPAPKEEIEKDESSPGNAGLDLSALGGGPAPNPDSSGEDKSTEKKGDETEEFFDRMMGKLFKIFEKKIDEKLTLKPENVATVTTADKSVDAGNDNIVASSAEFSRKLRRKFAGFDNLVQWAECAHKIVHIGGVKAIRAAKMQPRDLIMLSWIEDSINGCNANSELYRVAVDIGSPKLYKNFKLYLIACERRLKKNELNEKERQFFIQKGRIASLV